MFFMKRDVLDALSLRNDHRHRVVDLLDEKEWKKEKELMFWCGAPSLRAR